MCCVGYHKQSTKAVGKYWASTKAVREYWARNNVLYDRLGCCVVHPISKAQGP